MEDLSGGRVPARAERRSGGDRRREFRGGRRAGDIARALTLASAMAMLVAPGVKAETGVKFGFDANSVARARDLGMPVAYGSVWAGAWNQERYSLDGVGAQLTTAKNAGVTPVIQWWYWGDDLSPQCVESGCRDQYYGVWKDKATWDRLSNALADVIVRALGPNSGALIIVETEFNKASMQSNDTFDGWLAEKEQFFRSKGLRPIVGLGNWGRENWKNYRRAIAAADLMGVQALLSSVRNSTSYLDGASLLIDAARYNQATFGKPSFVTDFAFSSYPEPAYETYQDTVIRDIFRRMNELRAAGVEGMVWRMLVDDPSFDTANYHGMAERSWGLVKADGSKKLAFAPFLNGMLDERDRAMTPPSPSAPPPPAPVPEPPVAEPVPPPVSTAEPLPAPESEPEPASAEVPPVEDQPEQAPISAGSSRRAS